MISKSKIQESIQEIYTLFMRRNMLHAFTLDSIHEIFEIGNEVFMKNNIEDIEKISNRPRNKAPDLMDDEPFSFERALEIYQRLNSKFNEISPELIERVFEINSQLAWESYRKRYTEYILEIYKDHPDDEYLNYLAAIILYDNKIYYEALRCINISISYNPSSANYAHLKALCFIQLGEFESAHTYLYQALFLVEVVRDMPPKMKFNSEIYPNYPIEFHTNAQLIRGDLKKIDHVDDLFRTQLLPLLE